MTLTKNPLKTRLTDEFGLEFPIIAFTHCKDVVAAVVNAGGLSVYGAAGLPPEQIEKDVAWIRERIGTKAFGVDIIVPASSPPASVSRAELMEQISPAHWEFIRKIMEDYKIPEPSQEAKNKRESQLRTQEYQRKQVECVVDLRVPIFASGLGSPAFILEEAHAKGIKVFHLIGNVRQAVRSHEIGTDYIIAQGHDSAGHTGEIGTYALVPQVVAACKGTPIILAGGFGGSGGQLAAAMCLGAVGIWCGTLWLTSRESDVDPIVKEKLLAATERDTAWNRFATGKPNRRLRTILDNLWEDPKAPQPYHDPLQPLLVGDLNTSVRENKIAPFMTTPAGQGVGMVHEYKPAAQILFEAVAEAEEVFEDIFGR